MTKCTVYHLVKFSNKENKPISEFELSHALSEAGFKVEGVRMPNISTIGVIENAEWPSLEVLLSDIGHQVRFGSEADEEEAATEIQTAVKILNYTSQYKGIYGTRPT